MKGSQIARGKVRSWKSIRKIIKKYLKINEFNIYIYIHQTLWRRLIHVVDPTYCWWDKNRLFVVVVSFNRILNIVNLGVCVTPSSIKIENAKENSD